MRLKRDYGIIIILWDNYYIFYFSTNYMGLWESHYYNHYMGLREYHLFPIGIITIIAPYFPQFGHFWRILQSVYGIMGGYTSIV